MLSGKAAEEDRQLYDQRVKEALKSFLIDSLALLGRDLERLVGAPWICFSMRRITSVTESTVKPTRSPKKLTYGLIRHLIKVSET